MDLGGATGCRLQMPCTKSHNLHLSFKHSVGCQCFALAMCNLLSQCSCGLIPGAHVLHVGLCLSCGVANVFCLTAARGSCQAKGGMQAVFCQGLQRLNPGLSICRVIPQPASRSDALHQSTSTVLTQSAAPLKPWKPQFRCAQCQQSLSLAAKPCGTPCLSCPCCRICKPRK